MTKLTEDDKVIVYRLVKDLQSYLSSAHMGDEVDDIVNVLLELSNPGGKPLSAEARAIIRLLDDETEYETLMEPGEPIDVEKLRARMVERGYTLESPTD